MALAIIMVVTEVTPIMGATEATLITMVEALATIMAEVALITAAEVLVVVSLGLGMTRMGIIRVRLRKVRHQMETITARALRCGVTHSV